MQSLKDALTAITSAKASIRRQRLAVLVHGASPKKSAKDWSWSCEGCGHSNSGMNKEQAGYQAAKHREKCLKVYSISERNQDGINANL